MEVIKPQNEIVEPLGSAELPKWIEELLGVVLKT